MTVHLRPLDGPFGVEILGVDTAGRVDADDARAVEDALNKHSLVLLRDQHPSEEQHVAFSRAIGELEIHWLKQYLRPQHPEILVVSNVVENGVNIGLVDAGRYWHSDFSYQSLPTRGALLHAREVPVREGVVRGDTLFTNVVKAYDALSEEVKKRLPGMKAVFNLKRRHERLLRDGAQMQGVSSKEVANSDDVVRDVVQRHPITQKPLLYVNEAHTAKLFGPDGHEDEELLAMLVGHVQQAEFVYRHRWRVGDIIIWDNYATQHLAINDYELPERRVMYRTTLKGIQFPA